MVLPVLLIVLAADPRVSGDANITMKLDGKNEYAAGLHAFVPLVSDQLAVSVDVSSKSVTDAPTATPTTMSGFSLMSKSWALGVTMKTQPEGPPQPCVNARATVVTGPTSLTAQIKVTPGDTLEKVTGNVMWASTKSPVAVNVSASTRGSVSVGVSVHSM